jgi:hypothetical protein
MTTWAVLGLEAAGVNPLDVERGNNSPIDFLRDARISSATDLERTILALEGAGINSRSFEGRDLVAQLRAKRSGDGSWEGQVNITAFGVLALRSAGQNDVAKSADWLRDAQNANGGWGFAPGRGSDADSTGAALQALSVAGGSAAALADGARYLVRTQSGDGGWTLSGGVVNSQSTAWAVQGLVAAGGSGSATSKGVSYLARRQQGDGHYRYSSGSDQTPVWVTAQALTAVTRKPFPLGAVARAPRSGGGPEGSGGPGGASAGPAAGVGPRSGGAGPGSGKNGNERGEAEGNSGSSESSNSDESTAGDETADGADTPGVMAAETAASKDEGGLSDAAIAGVAGGVLALVVTGGVIYYRRSLA